jgi:Tol biopolymer transport system component
MVGVVLIALVVLTILAPAAEATFPGRNGDLLVTERHRGRGDADSSTLQRINPRSGQVTRTPICSAESALSATQPLCYWTGPPSASPDGRSVAFAASDPIPGPPYRVPPRYSARVLSLATGAWTSVPVEGWLLPYETILRWTPDLNFVVIADPHQAVLSGGDGAYLGRVFLRASAADVSLDGRIAFVRRGNVYMVVRRGDRPRRVTKRGGARPSWSPDSRRIAFTRRGWIYTIPARGGRARKVTRGFDPVWSPDGRQIAFFRAVPDGEYFDGDTTFVFALNRATGRVRRVSDEVMAVPDDIPPIGLDWQAIR